MNFLMIKFAQFEKKQYLCMLFRGARMYKRCVRGKIRNKLTKLLTKIKSLKCLQFNN